MGGFILCLGMSTRSSVEEKVRGLFDKELFSQLLISILVGVSGVSGSYLVVGSSPSFVSTVFSRFFARELPDVVIRYAITILGSLGQRLNLISAIIVTVLLFGLIVFVSYRVQSRFGFSGVNVPLALIGLLGVSYGLSGSLRSMAGVGIVSSVVLLGIRLSGFFGSSSSSPSVVEVSDTRREIIVAGLGAVGASSVGLWGVFNQSSVPSGDVDSETEALLEQAEEKSFDVSGMDALVSGNFYEVDINSINPDVSKDEWSLDVTGSVGDDVSISFDAVESMDTVQRFETLRCVGESLNGEKMDTAVWTGTPVMSIVEEAGNKSECECVMLRAEDGYYEEFPLSALEDAILAYRMNGQDLPRGHGAPVRLLVPGHWGEISVKWVSEIELLDSEMEGYWEERGWHGTGPVKTVAKLHAENMLSDGRRELGGHAYAGVRGIETVEVSVDGGETWDDAELTEPLEPSIDAWRQWKYTFEPPEESYTVVVRAIDGNGDVQVKEESGAFPSGPSGWVSREY